MEENNAPAAVADSEVDVLLADPADNDTETPAFTTGTAPSEGVADSAQTESNEAGDASNADTKEPQEATDNTESSDSSAPKVCSVFDRDSQLHHPRSNPQHLSKVFIVTVS